MKRARSKGAAAEELSPELLARLQAIAVMPEETIDTSDPDAPEATDWSGAERGRFYRPVKLEHPALAAAGIRFVGPDRPMLARRAILMQVDAPSDDQFRAIDR